MLAFLKFEPEWHFQDPYIRRLVFVSLNEKLLEPFQKSLSLDPVLSRKRKMFFL